MREDDKIHNLCVARNLLLIARSKAANADSAQQRFHFVITERTALDARGRTDALDRGDASQRGEPFGRQRSSRAPRAAELLNACEEPHHARRELRRFGREYGHIDSQIYP
jgi:hypothetical protein